MGYYLKRFKGRDLNSFKGINLGSGLAGTENWINVDHQLMLKFNINNRNYLVNKIYSKMKCNPYLLEKLKAYLSEPPPNYLKLNLQKAKLPFPDASLNFCYTSHFLEHLELFQQKRLLTEVERVLSGNGICRIVVPDLQILAKAYVKYVSGEEQFYLDLQFHNKPNIELNLHFGNIYDTQTKIPDSLKPLAYKHLRKYGHKYIHDFESIKALLESAGFTLVEKRQFRVGALPDLNVLDLENRRLESLYVEAFKS